MQLTNGCLTANVTPIILGIHGLTLHGRRFRVLARTMAINGIGFVSMDMRGFGQCRFDDQKQWSSKDDDKRAINYEKATRTSSVWHS